jgi:hypothetical protein
MFSPSPSNPKVPCETCSKRGCAAICPDGTHVCLTNGQLPMSILFLRVTHDREGQPVNDLFSLGKFFLISHIFSLILSNTEELHERIEVLCARNRDLEEALKSLQAAVSDGPHPLLQANSLTLQVPPPQKTPPPKTAPVLVLPRTEESRVDDQNVLDAFGLVVVAAKRCIGNDFP